MKRIYLILLSICVTNFANSQNKNTVTENYIIQYRDIAIENERDYSIPAYITLSQGILESGSGRSTLSQRNNNHFGIKCYSNWGGKRTYQNDDTSKECFRVYDNAEESFIDHSKLLRQSSRYSNLFNLESKDYKGWAIGLYELGYASNEHYSELLIDIIETYDLLNVSSDYYYLVKDSLLHGTDFTITAEQISKKSIDVREESPIASKKSVFASIFGNFTWYQRLYESKEEKKRRKMDAKIRKAYDKESVQHNDFEIKFD